MGTRSLPRSASRALLAAAPLLLSACERPPAAPSDPGPPEPMVEYVARQQILTELPMRVRLPARYGAERVLVCVHLWGTRGWRTLELGREGQTWEGAVSCRAVSTVTGDTQYFFLALDARGEPVVGSGSPDWPHVATIVRSLPGGPQGLADREPPAMCHDPADCPPDFAGCPAYAAVRGACRVDADCRGDGGGSCAWDGYCEGGAEQGLTEGDEVLATAIRKAVQGVRRARVAKSSVSARQ
jgi:hypothetical protein